MSLTNHPCNRYRCCENNGGQCFGGGCMRNPIRERDLDDETENETETETEETYD